MSRVAALLQELQQTSAQPIVMGLERVEALCARLGHPERRLPPTIHIAGTNGKGSLCAFLHALGNAAGLKAHRYISPHLVRFNERIVLVDEEIGDEKLAEYLEAVRGPAQELGATYFESTTVAAYLAFADHPADLLILETGMGGRLDATNVASPILTAITPISMDHQAYLGTTLAAIAAEKAGILKPGVPCVMGPQRRAAAEVLRARARELGCRLHACPADWRMEPEAEGFAYISNERWIDGLQPALPGVHQYDNAATAVACFELLEDRWSLTDAQIRTGLAQARWPARLQHLSESPWRAHLPEGASLWLDGGHNAGAGAVLQQWMATRRQPVHVICGMLQDKDHAEFLAAVGARAASLQCLAIPGAALSTPPEVLVSAAEKSKPGAQVAESLPAALQWLSKRFAPPYDVLICGSLYLAGYVLGEGAAQTGQS
jgi:dihydrofolate synthase/folylpolyglutamate synthase